MPVYFHMPSWDQNATVCEPLMNLFHLWLLLLLQSHSHVSAQKPPTEPNSHLRAPLTIVIVLIIVAAFCISICFFSIYNRNCAAEEQAASDSQGGNCPCRCQGLEPDVIKTFPILHYAAVKHLRIGEEALECAVCLRKFEDCEYLRLLLKCYHVFHPNCIDPWLASHVTCPVCRAELVPESKQLESGSTTPATQLNLDELLEISPRRKLQKSHSTGHDSLDQLEQNRDRYSLKLPEKMSRQLLDTSASSSNTIKSITAS